MHTLKTAAWLLVLLLPATVHAQSRQDEVAARGVMVMPFSLAATTHIFTKTADGAVQQVVTKRANDEPQRALIQAHLREVSTRMSRGDYAMPEMLHGADMPGLREMRAAGSKLEIRYVDLPNGGQVTYRTRDPKVVAAVHRWVDAQLTDHGPDAVPGHH